MMLDQLQTINVSSWPKKLRKERPGCDDGGVACNFLQLPVSSLPRSRAQGSRIGPASQGTGLEAYMVVEYAFDRIAAKNLFKLQPACIG